MPFNLRGGRPKNMRQGIYWVQRHQSDSRASAATATRLENQARLIAGRDRIVQNVVWFFSLHESVQGSASDKIRIETAVARWEEMRRIASTDLTVGNIGKLRTAGKNLILVFAKCGKIGAAWDAGNKSLIVDGRTLDFS